MVVIKEASYQDRIGALFANKTILITGATGFLGKVLIEKLLRSCTSLKKIYVIVRAKKGDNVNQRLRQLFNNCLFDRVKQQHGADVTQKVEAISGDMSSADLGLSVADRRKLTEEVDIIYHSAATIRFDDSLRSTVLLNVRGTKLLLQLARECRKLMVFSHVSTAFCHENQKELFEEFYPPPDNPHDVIKLCEELDEETLEKKSTSIRRASVNNYSFSKALAEALVEECKDTLPVIIQRPSVVIPIWKEPVPGWTDNINGATGLFIAGGKGVLRTLLARNEQFVDSCPVDVVVRKLIVNTYYYYYIYRDQRVFNILGHRKLCKELKISQLMDASKYVTRHKMPFNKVLWYPNISLKKSRIHHYVAMFLYQFLPALFVDMILYITGNKPFLMRIQKRIWKSNQLFNYYINETWNLNDATATKIRNVQNPLELESFDTSYDGFELEKYVEDGALYARRHIFKEPDEDIPAALERMAILENVDYYCKLVFVVVIAIYFFNKIFPC